MRALAVAIACLPPLALAACGGQERQDENERAGDYEVEVLDASFPERQKLAQRSTLRIVVRNADTRTIPNIAVTVDGFDYRKDDPDLADPSRPMFVINGEPKRIGGFPEAKEASPEGCDTAYVNTWACGPLKPNDERAFEWSVTASEARRFTIKYTVAAGLDGKAKAVNADGGGRPSGRFSGTISDVAPDSRVADDGETVIDRTR